MKRKDFIKAGGTLALATVFASLNGIVAKAQISDNTDNNASKDAISFTSLDANKSSITLKTTDTNAYEEAVITSGSRLSALFNKISIMSRNLKIIWNTIGTTDFSSAGSDLSSAVNNLNTKVNNTADVVNAMFSYDEATGVLTITPIKKD